MDQLKPYPHMVILALMSWGYEQSDIAILLGVSVKTVKVYRAEIYQALGLIKHPHKNVMSVVEYIKWKKSNEQKQR